MIARGFILQATYRTASQPGGVLPVVYLYGRLEHGGTFLVRDSRQRPSFYIRAADAGRQVAAVAGALPARAMILKLKPGGRIAPHIDQGAYAEATHRWHAAIETNGQAWLQIADERLHMAPGELWWFDKHALHYGANEGQTDRVHLIVDTFR